MGIGYCQQVVLRNFRCRLMPGSNRYTRVKEPKETKKLIHKFDVKTGGIKAVTQPLIKC